MENFVLPCMPVCDIYLYVAYVHSPGRSARKILYVAYVHSPGGSAQKILYVAYVHSPGGVHGRFYMWHMFIAPGECTEDFMDST